jgi:hypothetical protein
MKYLKMVGLAALAAMVLMAFAGAGSASAAVLCKTKTTPCNSKWTKGTQLEFSLKAGTSALWRTTESLSLKTCTGAKIKGEITNEGSGTESVQIKNTEISWSSCTVGTVTLKPGELEIKGITGSENGTVILKNAEFTTNDVVFGDCKYGTGAGADLGLITASATGDVVMDVNALLAPVGGPCCPEVVWTEEFTITSPKETPLFVRPS